MEMNDEVIKNLKDLAKEPGTVKFEDPEQPDYKYPRKKKPKPRIVEVNGKQIEFLGGLHCSWSEISHFFGMSAVVLRSEFIADFERGRANSKLKLRQKMFEMALGGSIPMAIFLAKNILKMSDNGIFEDEVEASKFTGFTVTELKPEVKEEVAAEEVKVEEVAAEEVKAA